MRLLARAVGIIALVAAPFVAFSLWLDTQGEATGTVTDKYETIGIEHEPTGGWYRRRYLAVTVPEIRSGFRPSIRVDSAEFDSIRRGDRVSIRYAPCCPLYARLATHTTRSVAGEAVRELGSSPLLDWFGVGFVALIVAARIASAAVLATGVAWLAAAMAFLFPARPPRSVAGLETTARVHGITLVENSPVPRGHRRNSWSHPERLSVPYDVVQLRFISVGRTDSVLAVDEVDAGSVASLSPGALVRVRYDPRAPRDAMLVDGSRSFRQRNRYHFLFLVLGCVGIGTASGLAWRLRRRRGRTAA